MVDPQASRFWQAAVQSELIDAEGLRLCLEAIPPEKRVAEHLDRRLARQAIHAGFLTLWQAQQLLAGRSAGFKINRYMLLDLIGQGGMGRVYLAKDTRLNRRVAVKILSPERVNNPRAIARFQREARVGAQLQHENLVRIYDEGEAGGKCYLVMEYIEGKNIGQMLAEGGPIPPRVASRLIRQVALGLAHAHQKGLIHRDVNPSNILVTIDGTAKLTDLGLAIDLAEEMPVTRDGATVGTFDYVSPEQARHSHSVDTRSDIYSLGCTLYHMLAGQVPFPSPSLPEKLFSHQAIDAVPLRTLVPGIPEGLEAIVMKMMKKAPDERYASPSEVAKALEKYAEPLQRKLAPEDTPPIQNIEPKEVIPGSDTKIIKAAAETIPPHPPIGSQTLDLGILNTEDSRASEPINLGIEFDLAPKAPAVRAEAPSRPRKEGKPASPPPLADTTRPEPPPPPTVAKKPLPPVVEPAETFFLPREDRDAGETKPPGDSFDLGIVFEPRASSVPTTPAAETRPDAKASSPKTKPAAPQPTVPPAPTREDSLVLDFSFDLPAPEPTEASLDLGVSLDLGRELSTAKMPSVSKKPAEAKAAAPNKPAAPAPKAKEPAHPALPADFMANLGTEKFASDLANLPGGVDLGVETSLSPTKLSLVPRDIDEPLPGPQPEPVAAAKPPSRPFDRRLLIGAGAAGLLVLVAGVAYLAGAFGHPTKSGEVRPAKTEAAAAPDEAPPGTAATPKTSKSKQTATPPADEAVAEGSGFAVRKGNGEMTSEPDLKSAMQRAIGTKGRVLLNNKTPLLLKGGDAAIRVSGGQLIIAAAPGTQPVLEVEVKGKNPFLSTKSDTPIQLQGITILARYAGPTQDVPPLIDAGQEVVLDRCVLRATGTVKGSRAVVCEGGTLRATGCWIEGFDTGLDVLVIAGKTNTIKNCMIVRAKSNDGWAFVVRSMPGGDPVKNVRKLQIERCTFKGKGLLDLVDFSPEAPLVVQLRDCAIQAEALLAWESKGSAAPSAQALKWSGMGNRYDIQGKAWVVLKADGSSPMPGGPSDFSGWTKLFTDLSSSATSLKFQGDASAPAESLAPSDFALEGADGSSAGADPGKVGPQGVTSK